MKGIRFASSHERARSTLHVFELLEGQGCYAPRLDDLLQLEGHLCVATLHRPVSLLHTQQPASHLLLLGGEPEELALQLLEGLHSCWRLITGGHAPVQLQGWSLCEWLIAAALHRLIGLDCSVCVTERASG